ncbi:hypothetical protein, partial [Methanobrevibacter sp. UBA337]
LDRNGLTAAQNAANTDNAQATNAGATSVNNAVSNGGSESRTNSSTVETTSTSTSVMRRRRFEEEYDSNKDGDFDKTDENDK